MTHRGWRWLAVALAALAFEAEALNHIERDRTFSHTTRRTFRTDCRTGRIAFFAAWTWLYVWYLRHIFGGTNG